MRATWRRGGRFTVIAAFSLTGLVHAAVADNPPVYVAKIIRSLPRSQAELAAAHAASRDASICVPIGQPIEIDDFGATTEYDVTLVVDGKRIPRKVPFEYSRLGVLTFGMQIGPEDEASLPAVSKNTILRRVNGNFIVLMVRVQRAPGTNEPYLYYKPLAAVGSYTSSGTQEFSHLMEDSVRDVRGLGLFIDPGATIDPASMRTFVGVNKNVIAVENAQTGETELKPHFEMFFARARLDGDKVTMHGFATRNDGKAELHYFRPFRLPANRDECSIDSTIFFTAYTAAKQSPTAKAERVINLASRAVYPFTVLDDYIQSQGLEGDALDHLTTTLDAVIDGKIGENQTELN